MESGQFNWPPHLIDAIPIEATQKKISIYTIALEGWRRGLDLKFYMERGDDNERHLRYSLAYQGREHHFQGSKGDRITDEAQHICDDKHLTYEALLKENVPVPRGVKFSDDRTDDDIVSEAGTIGFPLVLKPTNGSGGKGVIVNITSEEELRRGLAYVRQQLHFKDVIIEKFVKGEEYRVFVLEGQVLGAVNRLPANVIGDGKKTIGQLIEEKNEERKMVPHLYNRPIKLDKQFYNTTRALGITLNTVPGKGERVFLKRVSNISAGGDPVDVTDTLTEEMKDIAAAAVKAVPGLTHCGLDMIVDRENNTAAVIELNTRPGLGSHLFPIEGKGRDIPKALIDYYFPETAHISTSGSNIFFRMKDSEYVLKQNLADEVEMAPCPGNKLCIKKTVITSASPMTHLKSKVKDYLLSGSFSGYFKINSSKQFEFLLGHPSEEAVEEAVHSLLKILNEAGPLKVHTGDTAGPISARFDILEKGVLDGGDFIIEREKKLDEYELLTKDINRAEKRLGNFKKQALSKAAGPFRKVIKR
ncbi:ATP-grasp domain-containing protein [Salipaludibacillus aurantiacus]|uniref:D-alanine-D-alanine ligase n=1 Tax=Salipaludibacillus aurantiacus TaxID=1601833 RepID=A0A1H9VFI1_9BACI|nr:ATP-grasp domain-containing protein [Salipaludibacillus aurantiacus]SES20338.1 D-alanine-D-alanine ligase [Salipaludibacillus aurantiacus]